jgi:hypothetical protein
MYALNNPVLFSDPLGLECISGSTRLRLFGSGLLKVAVGSAKVLLAGGGEFFSAGALTPVAVMVGANGGANVFSGLALIYGAASGDKEGAERTARIADALSTPAGIFTLAVTRSTEKAQTVSAINELVMEGPSVTWEVSGGQVVGHLTHVEEAGEKLSALHEIGSNVEGDLKKRSKKAADCQCKE